jgi:hypothetical protein
MSDTETLLMQEIYKDWHALLSSACAASSVPESFLAGVIANESGGNPHAKRFEPAVFEHLKDVLLGTRAAYAPAGIKRPLLRADLVAYCDPGVGEERGSFAESLQCLHDLATSWGLTQIMGWHLAEFQSGLGVTYLLTPKGNVDFALRLLAWFAEHYGLDLARDFADLFDCWNSGDPMRGRVSTFDPNYVPNGLRRMSLYEGIALAAAAGSAP